MKLIKQISKNAFTLAEVLITLGIIGVVAAMTLPSLVNKIQGKELEAQYNKAYSVISQAIQRMNADKGFVANYNSYDIPSREFANTFMKYFITSKNCGAAGCSTYNDDDSNYLTKYKTYNGNYGNAMWFDDGQYIVSDGMFIAINHYNAGNKILIAADINGINKKPNRYGHDFFVFQILDDGKFLPLGAAGTQAGGAGWYSSSNTPEELCSLKSSSPVNGFTCGYFASTDKSFFMNLPK